MGIRWFQTGSPSEGVAFGHLPNPVMPNTFMAVAYDLGDAESPFGSVHIRYKTEVGERLALAGRRVAYGEDVCSGPVFNRLRVVDGSIDVEFNATSCGGLLLSAMNLTKAEDQGNWTGESPFEVCMPAVMDPIPASCGVLGKHDDWYPVPAATVRADGRTVTLSGLPGPVAAVRLLGGAIRASTWLVDSILSPSTCRRLHFGLKFLLEHHQVLRCHCLFKANMTQGTSKANFYAISHLNNFQDFDHGLHLQCALVSLGKCHCGCLVYTSCS